MGPGGILDSLSFGEKYGIFILLLILVIGALIPVLKWALGKLLANWKEKFEATQASIEQIKAAVEIIKTLSTEDREAFRTCVNSLETIASEEHWKNCPVAHCPNLTQILTRLNELMNELQNFVIEARSTRDQTQASIQSIFDVVRELSIEIIAALRSQRNGHR